MSNEKKQDSKVTYEPIRPNYEDKNYNEADKKEKLSGEFYVVQSRMRGDFEVFPKDSIVVLCKTLRRRPYIVSGETIRSVLPQEIARLGKDHFKKTNIETELKTRYGYKIGQPLREIKGNEWLG